MHKIPVILDMDTGVDDALALILALRSPELEVLGVTCAGGNVSSEHTALNTAAVVQQQKPFIQNRYSELPHVSIGFNPPTEGDATDVHGTDGMGEARDMVEFDQQRINPDACQWFEYTMDTQPPDQVVLITTGPLTNISNYLQECPQAVAKLKEVVSMCGVFFREGNRSPCAEFNAYSHPEVAKHLVDFSRSSQGSSAHLPLTMVGLDVTHDVRFQRQTLLEALHQSPKDVHLQFIKQATAHYMNFYNQNEGLDGCYLHDPLAVGYVIDPSFCQTGFYHVEVETQGEFTKGATVADYRPTRIFKNRAFEITRVCEQVDVTRFERFFQQRVLGI